MTAANQTLPGDDLVLPFQIDAANARGRFVRLGPAVDRILGQHDYPEPVACLLGETVAIAAMLATAIKFEGVFTLQAKGSGAVTLIVADVTSAGDIRGYARCDAAAVAALGDRASNLKHLLGDGWLAFTVDQGEDMERYQGIVELAGTTLAECVQHYFRQSEQIATGLSLAVDRTEAGWRAGAIMVQSLPEEESGAPAKTNQEDDWRHSMVLLATCEKRELLDQGLAQGDLLYRLFHEQGVRVYPSHALRPRCRCSRDKVGTVLRSLPRDELDEFKVEGKVVVTCEFCNTHYSYDDADIAALFAAPQA